jgi:Tat protein secretion system quality control protein TatD with DNase activity
LFSFYQHHECQKEVLRRQVAIALELGLPLVIHSRDSEQDMVTELEKVIGVFLWSIFSRISHTRVGILTWQKVILPGQWKKPVITGKKSQKPLAKTYDNVE